MICQFSAWFPYTIRIYKVHLPNAVKLGIGATNASTGSASVQLFEGVP